MNDPLSPPPPPLTAIDAAGAAASQTRTPPQGRRPPPANYIQGSPCISFVACHRTTSAIAGATDGAGYMVTIDAATNSTIFRRRRYTKLFKMNVELERFFLDLQSRFPECIIPAPPSRSLDPELYSKAADLFLRRVMGHPRLRESESARIFFDSEFQYSAPPPSSPRTAGRSSFLKAFSIGKSSDVDVYFEHARNDASAYESAASGAVRALDKVGKADRALSVSLGDVGAKFNAVALEESTQLAGQMRRVGKLFQTLELVHSARSNHTTNNSAEIFGYHDRCAQSALRSLDSRLEKLSDYDQACKNTQKKLQSIEKLRASTNIRQDKVEAALDELKEAKRAEGELRDGLKQMSEVLRLEYESFTATQNEELQRDISNYVTQQLHFDLQILSALVRAL
ncbi:hypothetical protein DFJ73DRAFT_812475 [Zopfochytrium polystomum]|nr:hypothetical protein DFJ73DRAFT_812475 [Zopfochytrium polystomum]